VIADTHIRRGGSRRLPDAVYDELGRADVVLHAGDVVAPELLDELSGFAPVHAVLGNNDLDLVGRLPRTEELILDGVAVAMIHDAGPRAGRAGRLSRRFPGARLVVFGHSHVPEDSEGVGGQRLFNPGSPTERRGQPHHTYGVLEVVDGAITEHRLIAVP